MILYEVVVLMLSNNQNIFKSFKGAVTKQFYPLVVTGNFFPSFFSVWNIFKFLY